MSSKLQFKVFFGEGSVGYGPNGIDLSGFKCTQSGIDKPGDRSFVSIYKWLERGFRINPETHVLTVQTVVTWANEGVLWELMLIRNTADWKCTWKRHLSVDGLLPCLFRLTRSHKLQPMRKMKFPEVHKGRGIKLRKRKRKTKRKNEVKRRM